MHYFHYFWLALLWADIWAFFTLHNVFDSIQVLVQADNISLARGIETDPNIMLCFIFFILNYISLRSRICNLWFSFVHPVIYSEKWRALFFLLLLAASSWKISEIKWWANSLTQVCWQLAQVCWQEGFWLIHVDDSQTRRPKTNR